MMPLLTNAFFKIVDIHHKSPIRKGFAHSNISEIIKIGVNTAWDSIHYIKHRPKK